MKTVLSLVLVLALSTPLWPQQGEGGTECVFQISVQDNGCGDGNCATSSNFSPVCDGLHQFALRAYCQGMEERSIYRLTAYVYDALGGGPIATLQNWDQENCGGWPDPIGVQLYTSHQYYIQVCLEACYYHNCGDCSSGGYAVAQVSHA